MTLHYFDTTIIVLFFAVTLSVGWFSMRRAGKDSTEFFLSGRKMPWWLLGFSMVATTFSAGTPNLITDIVRHDGIAGNWVWWAFLLTGMLTVFVYAKLWRRLGVMTDIEFYETRYSGKVGSFLRGFRVLYLGLIVNTVIMASATLAMVKILGVLFGVDPVWAIVFSSVATLFFSVCGGFIAVLWTDLILFIVAMVGTIGTAIFVVNQPDIGGLGSLLTHENVVGKLSFFPDFHDTRAVVTLLFVPFAIQWWSTWYPGSEPGGGSYTAQRILASKNESHAVGATLFFNFCHYAVRPWPWLLVALASLIRFPTTRSLAEAFPNVPAHKLADDLAYPAMLVNLPVGLSGLVLASLFAAYISTMSTHLNLGASYMVNDWYHRFINRDATEKQLVFHGRLWTVLLMIAANTLCFFLTNALQVFQILMLIGAGTGLLFLVRWFWWRINAFSELSAMVLSFLVAVYFKFIHLPLCATWFGVEIDGERVIPDWLLFSDATQLTLSVLFVTLGWFLVTVLTRPTEEKTLREFLRRSGAGGPGWRRVIEAAKREGDDLGLEKVWSAPVGILCAVISTIAIFSGMFATGFYLYGEFIPAIVLTVVFVFGMFALIPLWKRIV